MKLGEIKLAALEMMVPNETGVTLDTLASVSDPNVTVYIDKMPNVINRCFADIESKGVLASKDFVLSKHNASYDRPYDIVRGTTPLHSILLPMGVSTIASLVITYGQAGNVVLTKNKTACSFETKVKDGEVLTSAYYTLTQAETLLFDPTMEVAVEVSVVDTDGHRLESIGNIYLNVRDVLHDEVI